MAARKGDQKAFAQLVKRHERLVAAIVKGMLGDSPEAGDVGQETFIRLFHSLRSFRGEARLGTYLTRIAINLSLNELGRKKRRASVVSLNEGVIEPWLQSAGCVTELQYESAEHCDIVRTAIGALKPKLRAVVVLRLMEGYSTAETAHILKVPQGTVLSRLARAQMQLKKSLRPYLQGVRHEQ
jgi:RNA polymerase sigma-70 factor (ECF subfamily)